MTDAYDPQLEALAEAVVFAHEATAVLPADADPLALLRLEHAAALAAAALAERPAAPKHLQERLAAAGLAFCAEQRRTDTRPTASGPRAIVSGEQTARPAAARLPIGTFLLGLAAGVALWLALSSALSSRNQQPTLTEQTVTEQRASLLSTDPKAIRVPWKAGPSPKSGTVAGEVVWSQDRQQGFLSFRGLPPLDADHRFQLWIVDGNREGDPVDGGVFAVADATAETVVPVHAKLPIGKPAAFVVTVETKHGAVVSKQEHVVAIAGL